MKLKMLILGIILTATTSAFAQFFPARASAVVYPAQIVVQIFNPYYEPIACRGVVIGQTYFGNIFQNPFFDGFIPAGATRIAYLNTNLNNPFVAGRADIVCSFIRPF